MLELHFMNAQGSSYTDSERNRYCLCGFVKYEFNGSTKRSFYVRRASAKLLSADEDAEATVGNGTLRGRISLLRWSVAVECLKAAKATSKGNGWDRIILGARIQLGRENCENADILFVCREAVSVILFAR